MPDEEEQTESKRPIDMTSEELLDYAIHPRVAERVRELARECDEPDEEESS